MKLRISLWTWGLFATAILAGYAKVAGFVLLALAGHEIAHVLVTLSQRRKIHSLTIYPFGGVIRGADPLSLFGTQEIAIAFAGPAWNFFCTALGWLLQVKFLNYEQDILLWWQINLWMGLINLLPLFPLDGGRILAAILCTKFGYRRGIASISYGTQFVITAGVIYWMVFRHSISELNFLILAIVIFFAALKERQEAPFVLLRYLLKKNSLFRLRKTMLAKILAVKEDCRLEDIVAEMKEDNYYIICEVGKNGEKRLLGEKAIIDALLEKGAKVTIQNVEDKNFVV